MSRFRSWSYAVVAVVLASVLAGCSSGAGDAPKPAHTGRSGSSTGDDSAFPVTIDSALGDVTISKRPKRVVAIGWGSPDAALALGVKPVGLQDNSGATGDKTGILPWEQPKLKKYEPAMIKYSDDQVPYEKIARLKPDVILAVNSGLTRGQYQRLTKVAPTVAYPDKPWLTSWQDQLRIVGKALGREGEAVKQEKTIKQLIRSGRKHHPEFDGNTIAFGSGTETGSFNLYVSTDPRVHLLKKLGFAISPDLPKKASSFSTKLSLEKLDSIHADVVVAWYLDPRVKKTIEHNETFREMPAVKRHGYVAVTDPPMVEATSQITVLSVPWMLHRYLPLLSKAASGKAS